jgi:ABC-type polar amino acid transport system ATPase subunit
MEHSAILEESDPDSLFEQPRNERAGLFLGKILTR